MVWKKKSEDKELVGKLVGLVEMVGKVLETVIFWNACM